MIKQKVKFTIMAVVLFLATAVKPAQASSFPDEGMWLANLVRQLNFEYLKQLGLQLSADEIYNTENASLKDAVVQLYQGGSGFCTGELVSPNGLLFTNHHCGFDAIASQSTPDRNIIDDGYWAKSYAEELPIPGLAIRILQNAFEISDSIVPFAEGLDPAARRTVVTEIQNRIIARYAEQGFEAEVKSMYYGNQYFVYLYKVYNDVRLTGAPPSSVGNYGGDTDNWMWPRHTGDFSIFRVYADKTIYLTFDDGPNKGPKNMMHIVQDDEIPGTLFIVGEHVYGSTAQNAIFDSLVTCKYFEIANHSFTHAFKNKFAKFYQIPDSVLNDFKRCADSLHLTANIIRTPGRNIWRTGLINRTDINSSKAAAALRA